MFVIEPIRNWFVRNF